MSDVRNSKFRIRISPAQNPEVLETEVDFCFFWRMKAQDKEKKSILFLISF